jgi:anaphase-promoting complex subunit 2
LSQSFWPSSIVDEKFAPHPAILSLMKEYGDRYSKLKAPRRLLWKASMGSVQFTVELDSGDPLSLSLPPIPASVIMYLVDGPANQSIADLASLLKLQRDALLKRISPLISSRLISLSSDGSEVQLIVDSVPSSSESALPGTLPASAVSALPTSVPGVARTGPNSGGSAPTSTVSAPLPPSHDFEDITDSAPPAIADDGMAVFESFVIGMLTNLGPMPLDRIHNMLKMYCFDPPYDRSPEDLHRLLVRMIDQDQVDISAGAFSLKGGT